MRVAYCPPRGPRELFSIKGALTDSRSALACRASTGSAVHTSASASDSCLAVGMAPILLSQPRVRTPTRFSLPIRSN
eukprot:6199571-Pleurochrysis_carterae.AAC.2